ncbi:related to Laccase I precursor [Ustilago trichophora]|uniref:Related to Laccase I n=1 Tax=Ustilago trichophora TaxID=86804 RepID=A0A5C3EGP4_9BASI|nr:related to Laccase I precursor [Ustilago trichophora]
MRATRASPTPHRRGRRCLAIYLILVTSLLFLFAVPSGSISAAIPIHQSELASGNEGAAKQVEPHSDGEETDHRQLLIKRHEQISSGSVAAGFVHPTHLYRRDAAALPAPDKAYNMTVTQGTISPDGFERLGFLMNGKFPADPFVWDENDDVEITVNNQSPVPFAIHWHGIHQIGTPEMDGVPGLSQWNIYTGQSYTYRFKLINQYGGYWYHSHERGYYADGLRGTIYIRPKAGRKKPWNLISANQDDIDQMEAAEKDFQVMQLSDHWHINHTDMMLVVHETGVPPACFDSLQINGRGRQYCVDDWKTVISPVQASLLQNFSSTNPDGITSKGCISLVPPKAGYSVKGTLDTKYGGVCKNTTAPLTVFSAAKAINEGRKWLNLQIVDTSTNWYLGCSVDGHKMWIVAVDGHYVEPMQVDWAQITIGSRLSVMVELDSSLDGNVFPIRLTGARALQPIEGHAFLSYIDDIDGTWTPELEEDFGYAMRTLTTAHVPMSGFITDASVVKWQQNLSTPFDPISAVPKTSNMTLHAVASQNSLNVWQLATMPLDTAHLADERPMLFNATDGNATSNQMAPYASIPLGTVVDIIMENNIYSIVGGPNSPHPFHMHSRRFWIIGSGAGPFPADTVAEAQDLGYTFNLDTPPLRDGFDIDSNSWVVIRYVVDHAAANILHCHIDDHFMEGMAAVLLEGLETIPAGGNFSEAIKTKPANYIETQNDELGQVLELAWATGSANAKYVAPPVTETVTPWGDPRALANSIQLVASSNSVQEAITSSLQQELSLLQATATEEITGIIATVQSDHLTTFTGIPASSEAVTAAAAATALATATASVAAETADATDTAQSTLVAIAYTTRVVTQNASPTQAVGVTTVRATVTAVAPASGLVTALATGPAALATTPVSAAASAVITVFATVPATAGAAEVATAPATALATTPISALASVPSTAPASLIASPSVTAAVQATPSAAVSLVNANLETGVAASNALSLASSIAFSTLFRTAAGSASVVAVAPSAVQATSIAAPTGTQVATAIRTAASPQSSAVDDVDESADDSATASGTNDEAAEETSLRVTSAFAASALRSTILDTALASARDTSVAATARAASSTHVYSAIKTQQAISSAAAVASALTPQAHSSAAASLNRAASTVLETTQVVIRPSLTSAPAAAGTQSAYTTLFVDVSQSQIASAYASASNSATQSAASSPDAAAYGGHSAIATFSVDSTAAGLSSAPPPVPSATLSAATESDEPAYDNPVFPSTIAAVSTTQKLETTLDGVGHATITEPATATAAADTAVEDKAALDDDPYETYMSE